MNEESTKQKILLAAGPIFAKNGYQGATVRDISDAAGVNLASINYYFGDKEKLYVEAVKLAQEQQSGNLQFPASGDTREPTELLKKFIAVLLNKLGVGGQTEWQLQLLTNEFLFPGNACREIVESHFRPYFQNLLQLIDRIANVPLVEEQRLKIGFSIIGQCLHYRLAGPIVRMLTGPETLDRHFQVEAIAEHIARFSIAGIESYQPLSIK
jgi:TetR/AcrR family transcriptional regulator, regulator of cefoperazone and chloramphenicol sensitivity